MFTELSVIHGQYLRDILDQPRALQDTLAALEDSKSLRGIASDLNDYKPWCLREWDLRSMRFILYKSN